MVSPPEVSSVAASAMARENSATVGRGPARSRRAAVMPRSMRSNNLGVIVPSIISPLTMARKNSVFCQLRPPSAQCLLTGILARRHRLVRAHHASLAIKMRHVAGHKNDPAAARHPLEREVDQAHLRREIELHRVFRRLAF